MREKVQHVESKARELAVREQQIKQEEAVEVPRARSVPLFETSKLTRIISGCLHRVYTGTLSVCMRTYRLFVGITTAKMLKDGSLPLPGRVSRHSSW